MPTPQSKRKSTIATDAAAARRRALRRMRTAHAADRAAGRRLSRRLSRRVLRGADARGGLPDRPCALIAAAEGVSRRCARVPRPQSRDREPTAWMDSSTSLTTSQRRAPICSFRSRVWSSTMQRPERRPGPDFATQPTADDIEGTRANMLGPKLLDAAQFPFIVVHVAPMQVGPQSTQVQLSLQIRGHTSRRFRSTSSGVATAPN